MRAFLARLLRSLTSTTLSAQLAGMLIGGILFLHGVATFTVQLVEERQAARSALLEQVFEPFFRLDEARSPHTGGSGLGLSIARSMACRNGGELSLHNRPEGGLCARLCLYRSAMETETL